MATPDYVVTAWRKSSFSGGNGSDCVEVGTAAHAVLVRDTKHRDAGTLAFPPATWHAFLSTH